MDTYKIAIDTFLAETSECKASGCAVFIGADIAFQDIQLHTHRNKSELHFMAGHTMLSIPLASILSIKSWYCGISSPPSMRSSPKRAAPLPLTLFKNAPVKTEIRRAVRGRPLFKGEQPWPLYQRNKACLDPLNSITNLVIEVGSHTRYSHDSLSGAINLSTPFLQPKIPPRNGVHHIDALALYGNAPYFEIHFLIASIQIGQRLVIPSAGQTLTRI